MLIPGIPGARRCPPGGHRVLTGDIASFLKDLPGDVLPVSMKSRNRLRDFGLTTLGQIAALIPGPFQSQFGSEGTCNVVTNGVDSFSGLEKLPPSKDWH